MSFITTYCQITNTGCFVNGNFVASYNSESPDSWLKQLYKTSGLNYPKFYKMDMLAQAGYIASEFVKSGHREPLANYSDEAIAMVFANRYSSAESDAKFLRSYEEQHTPSPAMFVYTLPNMVLGEIAIANKWYGENMFAVLPKFDPDFYLQYIEMLLASETEAVLAGWLNVTEDNIEVLLFLVEKNFSDTKFNSVNLCKLIDQSFN
jgi:hypothetical protein